MIKREGIILNLMDYQESHKILYILTNEGIESLLVRRAKRYNSGILNAAQKLTKVQYVSNEKKLPSTNELSVIDNYSTIKDDIDKILFCEYLCEVLYKITLENTNFNLLYKMINALLEEIKCRKDYDLLFLQFKIKMLYFYGVLPNFKECYLCGNAVEGISVKNGGECSVHKTFDNIGNDSTKIIYLLYKDQFNVTNINFEVVKHLNDFIEKFYQFNFFMEFKSEQLLKKTFSL